MPEPSVSTPQSIWLTSKCNHKSVEFFWQEDRYMHRIVVNEQAIASSLFGDGDESWPPTPPIQQLSCEEINGNQVLFGVGAAGKSHWSLSVEQETHDSGFKLKFHYACRSKEQPDWIGSTYLIGDRIEVQPIAGSKLESSDESLRIAPVEISESVETVEWAYWITI